MAFELNTYAAKETFTLHLRNPDPDVDAPLWADDEETKPVTIDIYGKSSKFYRNSIAKMQNAQFSRGKQKLTAEQLRADGTALLVACSDKTSNLTLNGEEVNTPEAFTKLYNDPKLEWVRTQVDQAIENASNYFLK